MKDYSGQFLYSSDNILFIERNCNKKLIIFMDRTQKA